jgi:uncharacterized protein YjiS (DUF1127 family)
MTRAGAYRTHGDIMAPRAWWTNAKHMIGRVCIACRQTWRECRERDHLAALDKHAIDDLGRHRVAFELARR